MLAVSRLGTLFVRILLKLIAFLLIRMLINVSVLSRVLQVLESFVMRLRKSLCFVFHRLEAGMDWRDCW